MNIDQLFEDLESEFETAIELSTTAPDYGVERLTTMISGARLSIDRPTFGETYICGLVTGRAIWRFQPHRTLSVAKVTFGKEPAKPNESQQAQDLVRDSLVNRFVRYSLAGDGQQVRKGRVMGVMQGLILFESTSEVVAVAIDRLAWLEVHASDN